MKHSVSFAGPLRSGSHSYTIAHKRTGAHTAHASPAGHRSSPVLPLALAFNTPLAGIVFAAARFPLHFPSSSRPAASCPKSPLTGAPHFL
jgi:hypothetical protein